MRNLLDTVKGHLDAGGLFDGWKVVYYRLYDEDTAVGAEPVVMMRTDGGGEANEYGQQPDVSFVIVGSQYGDVEAGNLAQAIKLYLIEHNTADRIVNFEILADVIGPSALDNGRPMFQLNVRCWAENY